MRLGRLLGRAVATASLAVGAASCGDSLVPADYAGPPAATVNGTVIPGPAGSSHGGGAIAGVTSETLHPRMTISWIDPRATLDDTVPLDQKVTFKRPDSLEDASVEIALDTPVPQARFDLDGSQAQVAVGKIVYFDDRNQSGDIDWLCPSSDKCDVVKSVSRQFLVFVAQAPVCTGDRGVPSRAKMQLGYHYFRTEGDAPVESGPDQPLEFDLVDLAPSAGNPTAALAGFTRDLAAAWAAGHACL